jgi:hypothetical protein
VAQEQPVAGLGPRVLLLPPAGLALELEPADGDLDQLGLVQELAGAVALEVGRRVAVEALLGPEVGMTWPSEQVVVPFSGPSQPLNVVPPWQDSGYGPWIRPR